MTLIHLLASYQSRTINDYKTYMPAKPSHRSTIYWIARSHSFVSQTLKLIKKSTEKNRVHSRDWCYCRMIFEHACSMMNGKTQVVNSRQAKIYNKYCYELICIFMCDTMHFCCCCHCCVTRWNWCLCSRFAFNRNFEIESETCLSIRPLIAWNLTWLHAIDSPFRHVCVCICIWIFYERQTFEFHVNVSNHPRNMENNNSYNGMAWPFENVQTVSYHVDGLKWKFSSIIWIFIRFRWHAIRCRESFDWSLLRWINKTLCFWF